MKITGIICEYNPLHLGHAKQIQQIRQAEPDGCIVCLMSGNYVQRGAPAIFDKADRARAAVECGADLVLELPVTASLSSAEGFASQSVAILGGFCDQLSFGAENDDIQELMTTAQLLLRPAFSDQLKQALAEGCSFPAAREKALEKAGGKIDLIRTPNNILAIEYCKAILTQNIAMRPMPIKRAGNYHALSAEKDDPSATAVRQLILQNQQWQDFVPAAATDCFSQAAVHSIDAGEKAILARLRTMTDDEFQALPYGNEGLWRKLMKNARSLNTLEDIIQATKSKRYTRTRLDRMIMCAFLGITQPALTTPAPYIRVLAFNDKGRVALTQARQSGDFINIGEKTSENYELLERRSDDLYGLFVTNGSEAAGNSCRRRIYYKTNAGQLDYDN